MRISEYSETERNELQVGTMAYSPLTGSHYWLLQRYSTGLLLWTNFRGEPCELPQDAELYPQESYASLA